MKDIDETPEGQTAKRAEIPQDKLYYKWYGDNILINRTQRNKSRIITEEQRGQHYGDWKDAIDVRLYFDAKEDWGQLPMLIQETALNYEKRINFGANLTIEYMNDESYMDKQTGEIDYKKAFKDIEGGLEKREDIFGKFWHFGVPYYLHGYLNEKNDGFSVCGLFDVRLLFKWIRERYYSHDDLYCVTRPCRIRSASGSRANFVWFPYEEIQRDCPKCILKWEDVR